MTALLRILFLIPAAYMLACLVAGGFLVLAVLGVNHASLATYGPETLLLVVGVAAIAGGLGAIPAMVAIMAAEAFGWRSLLFYLGAGAVIGLATHLITPLGHAPISPADAQLFLAAGSVGGFAYWLVAGRSAGSGPATPR